VDAFDLAELERVDDHADVAVAGEPGAVVLIEGLVAIGDAVLLLLAVAADVENGGELSFDRLGTEQIDMGEGLRFLWNATRGDRLRPWRSAYLRWRVETYTGQRADTVTARDFWRLFWTEKRQLFRFFQWTGEIRGFAETGRER